jgi:hypothetical protein
MSAGLLAIMFGLGVGAWIYNKTSHRTGHNTRTSIITAVFVGLIVAFIFYTLFRIFIAK